MKRACGLLFVAFLAWGQRPSDEDAAALLAKARARALDYTRSLPDFMCMEVVHRYAERSPQEMRALGLRAATVPSSMRWLPTDKLTVKLSYFQQREEHKLVSIDDKPTDQEYNSLTGGVETGEFGGTLYEIFMASTATTFQWESWKTVRKHHTAVYAYQVDAAHSRYQLMSGPKNDLHSAVVGFHGILEIDRETGEVLHFTYVADGIPATVKLTRVTTVVDYDEAKVGGRDYLLPSHSATEIHSPGNSVRNEMDFREYRKFSADSSIQFGPAK